MRGSILEEIQQDTDHFNDQNKQLLKFHGSYQQEDRDARKNRKKEGVGKHYMFMVRCKIPGGRLTAPQYLAVDHLAGEYGNGTVRFTSRQGIQLHGVLKSDLKNTIAGINACLLSTLGACGDVERNVMACPAPHADGIHAELQETAAILAAHLAPRSKAYHEIWLNGKRLEDDAAVTDIEPIYGKVYLPRKFKTGLALPEDNCIDIHAQDLGLLALVHDERIVGYNVLVGGGMGMTHGNANTFPHLSQPICYVPAKAVVGAAEAVVKLFRDHGNRADRKRARIKYLVHDWGIEKFRQVLSEYIGGKLEEPRPIRVTGFATHLGWHPQGNDKWYYGLSIENGRIKDEGQLRLRSGLRALVERFQPSIRLTPLQDILLCDLDISAKTDIDRMLAEYGIPRPDQVSPVRRHSMACPAIPTCGLALSESERVLPGILDRLETELKRLGLQDEKMSVRMTGCPNGCARPYQSDIGVVGRSGDKYTIFVGGEILGRRLNFVLRDLVPMAEIVPILVPVLEHYQRHRHSGEGFGDYCHRLGEAQVQALLPPPVAKSRPKTQDADAATLTSNGEKQLAPPRPTNGEVVATDKVREAVDTNTLIQPETHQIPVTINKPVVFVAPAPLPDNAKQSETFLAGPLSEELADYTFSYNSDGSVRQTAIYFYEDDRRATAAKAGHALRREAVYLGKVDPFRLHAARKLSDTYYVGAAGHELRDIRVEYNADAAIARTVVFYYQDDLRAGQAPSGAVLRRQVCFEGKVA